MQYSIRNILMLGTLAAMPLAAQVKFGVTGGVVSANLELSSDYRPKALTGLGAGLAMTSGRGLIQFAPELLYSMRGATIDLGYDARTKMSYLELPLLIRMSPVRGARVRPFVFAGPSVGLLLSCTTSGNYLSDSINGDCDDIYGADGKDSFTSTDFAAVAGAGAHIGRITLTARYARGLVNINGFDAPQATKIRSRALMVLAAFMF